MQNIQNMIMKHRLKNRRWKMWKNIVSGLACVVVFCTVYALILPAITLENKTYCEQKEHVHAEACYSKEVTGTDHVLVCEVKETQGHAHEDSCYGVSEQEPVLICTTEETQGHAHTGSCYQKEEDVLVCQSEEVDHVHEDVCYQGGEDILTCTQEEVSAHAHEDSCYQEAEKVLICEHEEALAHIHSDGCYEEKEIFGDKKLACLEKEHEHTEACYSNPKADIETREQWEKTLANVELTGIWEEDVLAIAESQLGYNESDSNYITTDSRDKKKGYTRYGEWYGDPYGHWCAMYVSFCLNYAEIPETEIPYESNCENWVKKLAELEMYAKAEEYMPEPGDIIFFDNNNSDIKLSDHVGIVKELICEESEEVTHIKTIEGNSGDTVRYVTYDISDRDIVGYGLLPENDNLKKETIKLVQETDQFTATAVFEEGVLPADAKLEVELLKEEDVLEDVLTKQVQSEGKELLLSQRMTVDFASDSGESVEPEGEVQFRIEFKNPLEAVPEQTEEVSETEGTTQWLLYRIDNSENMTEMSETDASLTEVGEASALKAAAFAYEAETEYAVAAVLENAQIVTTLQELKDAIAGEKDSDVIEIRLGADIRSTAMTSIGGGKTVVLDLAGYTITSTAGTVFDVVGGSSLTIMDSVANPFRDVLRGTVSTANVYGNEASYEDGKLTYYVTESEIENSSTGATKETLQQYIVTLKGKIVAGNNAAIYIDSDSTFTLESGAIVGGSNRAINQVSGQLNLKGGYICGNKNSGDGGAITSSNSNITLTGTVIAANSTDGRGGAIYANNTKIIIDDTAVISGNVSTWAGESQEWGTHYGGGGIYCGGNSTVEMNGGYVTNNISKANGYFDGGGGFLISGTTTFTITGGYITGNAANGGGGIRTDWRSASTVNVKGGYTCSNHAYSAEGGGISINMDGAASITAGYINNNIIGESNHWGGGGVFCSNGSKIFMRDALITENHAYGFGGGVAGCSTGRVYICVQNGGAIYDNSAEGLEDHLSGDTSTKNEDHALAYDNEVFMSHGYQDYFCALNSMVDGTMLGNNPAYWRGSADGYPVSAEAGETLVASSVMGLTAHPDAIGKAAAQQEAKLYINGNVSNTHGGGVLANGYLIVGMAEDISVSARIELSATKAYYDANETKIEMEGGEFKFTLSDEKTETVITTGVNDAEGNIVFADRLPFTQAGTYVYLLKEEDPKEPGVIKDTTVYRITIKVSEEKTERWETIFIEGTDGKLSENQIIRYRYLVDEILIEQKNGNEWKKLSQQNPNDSDDSAIKIAVTSDTTFTNYKLDTTNVRVEKKWAGDVVGKDEIEVTLYQNESIYETVKLNQSNSWMHVWENLPMKEVIDDELVTYTYSVQEEKVPGYQARYEYYNNVEKSYYWIPATTLVDGERYIVVYQEAGKDDQALYFAEVGADVVLTDKDKIIVRKGKEEIVINDKTYSDYYDDSAISSHSVLSAKSERTDSVSDPKGRVKLQNAATSRGLLIQGETNRLKGGTGLSGYISLFETSLENGLTGHYEWGLKEDNSDINEIYYDGSKFNAVTGTRATNPVKVYTRVAGPLSEKEIVYVITNVKEDSITYGLNVTKISSDDPDVRLTGAHFNLKDAKGKVLNFIPDTSAGSYTWSEGVSDGTITTDLVTAARGKLVLSGLPAGTYTLIETQAPVGYKVAEPQTVILGEDPGNPTIKIDVIDYREDEYILPETGGIGTNMFTTGGIMLMMISLLLGIAAKRKRERRVK